MVENRVYTPDCGIVSGNCLDYGADEYGHTVVGAHESHSVIAMGFNGMYWITLQATNPHASDLKWQVIGTATTSSYSPSSYPYESNDHEAIKFRQGRIKIWTKWAKWSGSARVVKIVPTSTMVENRVYTPDCGIVSGNCLGYGADVYGHTVVGAHESHSVIAMGFNGMYWITLQATNPHASDRKWQVIGTATTPSYSPSSISHESIDHQAIKFKQGQMGIWTKLTELDGSLKLCPRAPWSRILNIRMIAMSSTGCVIAMALMCEGTLLFDDTSHIVS
jgi:hypothetical protein